ncbi:hypothetical protein SAMN05443247_00422 [Bradyrhizobium erythrophlei]|nr:hypothetical protein SAMN05443247_00422 [Bradyrhizobium erythrophlei]
MKKPPLATRAFQLSVRPDLGLAAHPALTRTSRDRAGPADQAEGLNRKRTLEVALGLCLGLFGLPTR